jgi:hypothetical protein
LSFKKVRQKLPNSENVRSKVLRYKCAKKYLEILREGKTIINIDETALVDFSYSGKSWSPKGELLSVSRKIANTRISLVAAIDNFGELFYSVKQSNSNTESTLVMLSQLVRILDNRSPSWRNDRVVMLDNATYHRSKKVE